MSLKYDFPARLLSRPIDILALGSAILEQVIRLDQWPSSGGQAAVNIQGMDFVPGGGATNVSCFAARLGGRAQVITCLGDGEFSQPVWDEFEASGVGTEFVRRCVGRKGNLVIELTDPHGDWAVMGYLDPEIRLGVGDVPPIKAFEKAKVLHIDGFSYVSAGDQETVEIAVKRAKEAGCLVSVDGCVPAATEMPAFMARLFSEADFVFANLFEAQAATGAERTEEVIRAFQRTSHQLAVLKLGDKGSYVISKDAFQQVPAYKVEVVDTVAAGDSYIGTFLLMLIRGDQVKSACRRGSAAGALACMGPGSLSNRFTLDDIDSLISRQEEPG